RSIARPTQPTLLLFSFTSTAPTDIYTLSLHDALPIFRSHIGYGSPHKHDTAEAHGSPLGQDEITLTKQALGYPSQEPFYVAPEADRKSTRLNSSHVAISYAVFCLKKKKIRYN